MKGEVMTGEAEGSTVAPLKLTGIIDGGREAKRGKQSKGLLA